MHVKKRVPGLEWTRLRMDMNGRFGFNHPQLVTVMSLGWCRKPDSDAVHLDYCEAGTAPGSSPHTRLQPSAMGSIR